MSDDRADLIESHLRQLEAFRASVPSLVNQGGQQQQTLGTQWNTLGAMLATKVLPKLGPGVQLASRSMMALVTGFLSAAQHTEQMQNMQGPMRQVWAQLLVGQLTELEALLRAPPDIPTQTPTTLSGPGPNEPDRAAAKALLTEAIGGATTNETDLRTSATRILVLGAVLAIAAAALPFIMKPDASSLGWALVVAWALRVLAVASLVVLAIHAFNLFRDMMARATGAAREQGLLKVLGAASYLGSGKDQATALVDLVRTLSQDRAASKDESLVVPAALLKELPEIIKVFKGNEKK